MLSYVFEFTYKYTYVQRYMCKKIYVYKFDHICIVFLRRSTKKRLRHRSCEFRETFENTIFKEHLWEIVSVYKYKLNTRIYSALTGVFTYQIKFGSCAYRNNLSHLFSNNNPHENFAKSAGQNLKWSLTKVSGLL